MMPADRPGLLLMCHGDLPEAAMADPGYRRLYAECAELYELLASEIVARSGNDFLSGLNGSIASFLSSESDGPVEQACLGFGRPGVREAMFRLVARGSRSLVCVGGAGLVLPCQGAAVHLPEAVGQVVAENAGLDVSCARPGYNPHVAAALIMASVEGALNGGGIPPGPSWETPRIGGDTGVIVVSAPDPSKALAACSRQSASYVAAAKRLSDYLRTKPAAGLTRVEKYMTGVAESLEATGAFCAVCTSYLDFTPPDIEAACDRMVKAGARQIIATGMPLLLSRHPFSWVDPARAFDHLEDKCPADLVYVKPDPQSCAEEIAAMLRMNVLEAAVAARQQ